MAKIKIKRGTESNIGNITLDDGEMAITTDTKKLFIGIGGAKICLGGASSLGDMLKSIYDTNNTGIVDNAEALNGEPGSYYLNYNNFSNKPAIPISLPANGGNADTVDGKHASDFAASSHTHTSISIPDTRSVATTPSDYSSKIFEIQFKSSSVVGLSGGTYCTILGFRSWSDDSGGIAYELGFQSDGIIKVRTGTTSSGWGSWKTLKGALTWNDLKGV